MAAFKDTSGREWEIRIDGPAILRVRENGDEKFLLKDDDENNTASRLSDDPALLCHVIYLLCEKQRNERGVTLDSFYQEVIGSGEAIEAAGEALEKAIANFTPPRKRDFITAVASKQRKVEDLAMAQAMAKLNDPELEDRIAAAINERIDAALNKLTRPSSATSSPDSVESIQTA